MKTKDPRSAIKRAKDTAYAKLPPAIIFKPLRFIGENTVREQVIDQKTGEVTGYLPSPEWKRARIDANQGQGAVVQSTARRLALAVA